MISQTSNKISYSGNGVTTEFAVPFEFYDEDDLVVIEKDNTTLAETVKTIVSHYTVAGGSADSDDGQADTGTITMLSAPASGKTLIIYNDRAIEQDFDLAKGGSYPAETIEKAFDVLTLYCRRLKTELARCVRLQEGFTATFDPKLPPDLNAGATIIVNADEDGFEEGPSADDIENAQANAEAAADAADAAEAAQAAAEAAQAAVESVMGAYALAQTAWTPANGQAVAANISGFIMNASAKALLCEVWVRTKTDTDERNGIARFMIFKKAAGTYEIGGVQWDYAPTTTRPDITFSLSSNQVQYVSGTHSGANFVGTGKFQARSID